MTKGNLKRQIIQYSLLVLLYYCTTCVFNSFFVYYLKTKGYKNTNIGIVLLINIICSIIGQYFWGYICDIKRTIKKVFIFCMFLLILCVFLVPRIVTNISLILLLSGMIGFLQGPMPAIIDCWILQSSKEIEVYYGFIRAWGSIGFAIVANFFGGLIYKYGWQLMFKSFAIFAALAIAITIFIKDSYRYDYNSSNCNYKVVNPLILFNDSRYTFLIIISILIFIPEQVCSLYLSIIIKNVGGTPKDLGIALFANAMWEIPMLFLFKYLIKKFKADSLILISAFFYFIKIVVLIFCINPTMIIYTSIFQAVSFAIYLPASKYYINKIAPYNLKTTAQTVATACYVGISGLITSYFGGVILDKFGVIVLLKIAACIGAGAFNILLIYLIITRRKENLKNIIDKKVKV